MCSIYMRYGEEIDEYLQNRPRPLIRHCLLKKNLGENLDLTGIRVTATDSFQLFTINMVKGDNTMLTLEGIKQCHPVVAQTGKCQRIHANI